MKIEGIKIQMPYRVGKTYNAGEWVDVDDIIEKLDQALGEIDELNEKLNKEPTEEDNTEDYLLSKRGDEE